MDLFDVFISAFAGKSFTLDEPIATELPGADSDALRQRLEEIGFTTQAFASHGESEASRRIDPPENWGNALVSNKVLSEIRVTICNSLETAIDMAMECRCHDAGDMAVLIRPAVERLQAICEENNFHE